MHSDKNGLKVETASFDHNKNVLFRSHIQFYKFILNKDNILENLSIVRYAIKMSQVIPVHGMRKLHTVIKVNVL